MSPSVFLLVFIRPVWFLRQVVGREVLDHSFALEHFTVAESPSFQETQSGALWLLQIPLALMFPEHNRN